MFNFLKNKNKESIQINENDLATKEWEIVKELALSAQKGQEKSRKWGVFFKFIAFTYLIFVIAVYAAGHPRSWFSKADNSEPIVGFVNLSGSITESGENNADKIVTSLTHAFDNPNTVAIILRINSPGGSPVQSHYISSNMERLREKYPEKPLYAVISDIGASGGYYIATGAENIYASEASLVGSIGVTASNFGFVDLIEKMGIERRLITSGENKSFLDPFVPLKEDEKEFFKTVLSGVHDTFINQVRKSRGDRLNENDVYLFGGLIWNGKQAKDLGLIDGFASSSEIARDIIGVEKMVDFTYQPSPWIRLFNQLGINIGIGIGKTINPYIEENFIKLN